MGQLLRILPENTRNSEQTDSHAPFGSKHTTPTCERSQFHYLQPAAAGSAPWLTTVNVSSSYTGQNKPRGLDKAEAHRIARQLAHEGGKIVNRKHRPPLPAMC